MFYGLSLLFRWYFSLGRKFFSIVPGINLVIVVLTLVSQVSLLLAFVLPLKIIILLGASTIPVYFPDAFESLDRDVLVVMLTGAAVGFYLLHLLAGNAIDLLTRKGADILLSHTRKMVLFVEQNEIARQGYLRYSRSLASSIFVLLVLTILGYIYPFLLLTLCAYWLVATLVLWVGYRYWEGTRERLEGNPGPIISTLGAVGFLSSFIFLVYMLLQESSPNILWAIIAILLIRQALARLDGIVADLRGLYAARIRINALFFHGHLLVSASKPQEERFWSLAGQGVRENWIKGVIDNAMGNESHKIVLEWVQSGVRDVIAFKVDVLDQFGSSEGYYLIRLFSTRGTVLAQHEESLLAEMPHLSALPLFSVDEVNGFHCQLFRWVDGRKAGIRQLKIWALQFREELMTSIPSGSLMSQHFRSHPVLWQRLDEAFLARLQLIAETHGPKYSDLINRFVGGFDSVRIRLQALPMCIVNPDLQQDMLLLSNNGKIISLFWGRWSLEPIGAGWPLKPKEFMKLGDVFDERLAKRDGMQNVSKCDVFLAALMFGFEYFCKRQNYSSAFDLLPDILGCIENIVPSATKEAIEFGHGGKSINE